MSKRVSLLCALFVQALPVLASAQGILVDVREDHRYWLPRPHVVPHPRPVPPSSYQIKELSVNARLVDQVATVQVSQSFVNTGSGQMEVCVVFPLPYDGAVSQLTLMVDGKEYAAKLLSAAEARQVYESYVRRNKDPALMEWIGTGMFQTSIFPVPAGARRTVTLRYSQICRKIDGLTEFLFPLSTAKYTSRAVEKVAIDVHIQSRANIKNLYSPTHDVKIARPSDRQAHVTYEGHNEIPARDFRLFSDVGSHEVGASVLSYRPDANEDGYFLLLVSPQLPTDASQRTNKTVVFVLDRSGSMSGKKIEQAKEALKFVLNNLQEGDLFNIVAYDSAIETFRAELERVSDQSRKEALGFVEGLYAGGSTNIDGALRAALGQLVDAGRPSYVIFLTDGLPTVGEQNEGRIVSNAQQANQVRARLFVFGVGYDVNSRLLDKLARVGFGQSQYVGPDENIEAHVSRLYQRIGSPVLTNMEIQFDMENVPAERGSAMNRIYPRQLHDLFAGDGLVLVGRYKSPGSAKVTIRGKEADRPTSFDFPAQLVERSADESHAFIEKLWAVRRVGEIIDQIDLEGKNQELIDELIALAKRHGILTPYTSFLADENATLGDVAVYRRETDLALGGLERVAGRSAFSQRQAKADLQQAISAPQAGWAKQIDVETGVESTVMSIQHVGTKTFLSRDGRWVDSTLTEAEVQKARPISRYASEYFELIEKHGNDVAKYLALEGDVTVELGGMAYAF